MLFNDFHAIATIPRSLPFLTMMQMATTTGALTKFAIPEYYISRDNYTDG